MVRRFVVAALLLLTACSAAPTAKPSPTASNPRRRDEAAQWYLRSISEDGRSIAIVYTVSGVASDCQRPGAAFADESAEKVAVVAYKSVSLDRNRPCTEELGFIDRTVLLKAPLGSRALVGCRPGHLEPSENDTCRSLERSRSAGVFEVPTPSPLPGG
jgi:hypothetical protein